MALTSDIIKTTAPNLPETKGSNPYLALEIAEMIIPLALGTSLLLYKEYFSWLGTHVVEVAGALFLVAVTHIFLYTLLVLFKRPIYQSLIRYLYLAFFLYTTHVTGGVLSSFIFLLLIPTVSAATYLLKDATRNIGIATSVTFAFSVFFMPVEMWDASLFVEHVIHVLCLSIILYLVYRMVSEALQQKAEKEESTRRLEQTQKVDQLKNDFLSIAQHQLRTPLSGVKWALEMLKTDTTISLDSATLIDAGLERVKDSIGIINQMLKTVDMDGSTLMVTPETFDLAGMIRTILAELNFIILKKETKVTFIGPDSLLMVADRSKMKAAIINIIDNSIKYSPHGKVTITLLDTPKEVSLTVQDSGIGISPDDLPHIFDRLHRGSNAVAIEPDESGVGLYTSKKIIELHGGTITLSSELNKGTKIVISFEKK